MTIPTFIRPPRCGAHTGDHDVKDPTPSAQTQSQMAHAAFAAKIARLAKCLTRTRGDRTHQQYREQILVAMGWSSANDYDRWVEATLSASPSYNELATCARGLSNCEPTSDAITYRGHLDVEFFGAALANVLEIDLEDVYEAFRDAHIGRWDGRTLCEGDEPIAEVAQWERPTDTAPYTWITPGPAYAAHGEAITEAAESDLDDCDSLGGFAGDWLSQESGAWLHLDGWLAMLRHATPGLYDVSPTGDLADRLYAIIELADARRRPFAPPAVWRHHAKLVDVIGRVAMMMMSWGDHSGAATLLHAGCAVFGGREVFWTSALYEARATHVLTQMGLDGGEGAMQAMLEIKDAMVRQGMALDPVEETHYRLWAELAEGEDPDAAISLLMDLLKLTPELSACVVETHDMPHLSLLAGHMRKHGHRAQSYLHILERAHPSVGPTLVHDAIRSWARSVVLDPRLMTQLEDQIRHGRPHLGTSNPAITEDMRRRFRAAHGHARSEAEASC